MRVTGDGVIAEVTIGSGIRYNVLGNRDWTRLDAVAAAPTGPAVASGDFQHSVASFLHGGQPEGRLPDS